MKKRGQATLFIIIGLLVVIAGGVVVYINYDSISSELGFGEDISKQADSAQILIDECTKLTLRDAVSISLNQGGRIYPQISAQTYYEQFTNSLRLYPFGNVYIPYWFYESGGVPYNNIPTTREIENDISKYLENSISSCLDNFTSLREDIKVKIDEPKFKAAIYENEAGAILKSTASVEYKDTKKKIPLHEVKIGTNFRKLYDSAVKVMEKENSELFFEHKTYDMMVLYDEIPKSGTTLDCFPNVWDKREVISNFKRIISINTPYYKIKGSDYTLAKESRKYFELAEIPELPGGIVVNFIYSQSWPFYLNIPGHTGNVIRSDAVKSSDISKLAGLFCINDYHFVYDVKYPIVVSLTLGEEIFQFAAQVVIDNNEPRKLTTEPFFAEDFSARHCVSVYNSEIIVFDEDDSLIEGTDIEYQCVNHGCPLGMTNSEGYLNSGIPACVNGILRARKQGYADYSETLSTNLGAITKTIRLEKLHELSPAVSLSGRSLKSNEKAIITLKNQDSEYETTVILPGDKKMELVPGVYKVDAIVVLDEKTQIKEEKIKECINDLLGVCLDYYETILPATELQSSLIGGGKFVFEVSKEHLKDSDSITFNLYLAEPPKTYPELARIQMDIEEYQNLPEFKEPELK